MTDFLGFIIRDEGYNGSFVAVALVYDRSTGKVLGVTPYGFYTHFTEV